MLCFLRHPNDHISVMSASQIPKHVRHVPRKFNIFRMYNKNSAIVSCQTHKFQKKKKIQYFRVMSDTQIPKTHLS